MVASLFLFGSRWSHFPALATSRYLPIKADPKVSNQTCCFWFVAMCSVPFEFVSGLAAEFGAVECFWRESDRSFTGFVAEVWFASLPSGFAARWSEVVGYSVLVRCPASGPGRFAVSVPCSVPDGVAGLEPASRGSRVRLCP